MIRHIGRTGLLVHDYEEALEFYRNKLGFEMIFDQLHDDGYRTIHIGPSAESGIGLWLMKAESDEQRARVGRQVGDGPLLVVYTDDCERTYDLLKARGVQFLSEPKEGGGSIFVHFNDLYGNEIVLVELCQDRG